MYEVSDEYKSVMNREFRNPGHARFKVYGSDGVSVYATVTDAAILSAECSRSFSSYTLELPTMDFSVTITTVGTTHTYTEFNSVIGLKATLEYGITLDDQSIEWVLMGTGSISDVSFTRDTIVIKGTDDLRGYNSTYDDDIALKVVGTTRTAFDRFITKTGITIENLDTAFNAGAYNYNESYVVIPNASYKQALQMLANSVACDLLIQRNGKLKMVYAIEERRVEEYEASQTVGFEPAVTGMDIFDYPALQFKDVYKSTEILFTNRFPNLDPANGRSMVLEMITQGDYTFENGKTVTFIFKDLLWAYDIYVDGQEWESSNAYVGIESKTASKLVLKAKADGSHNIGIKGCKYLTFTGKLPAIEDLIYSGQEEFFENEGDQSVNAGAKKSTSFNNPIMGRSAAEVIQANLHDTYNPQSVFTIKTRGEPELDPGDVIVMPAAYNEDSQIVNANVGIVLSNKVSFNGAFRGEVTAYQLWRDMTTLNAIPEGYRFRVQGDTLECVSDGDGYSIAINKGQENLYNVAFRNLRLMQVLNDTLLLD